MAAPAKTENAASRNPERTRGHILSAALKEFAAKGFAGARMDVIARRAAINKRMLYHYFGDKEGLFKAVLRRKISERQTWAETLSGDPAETLPFWFEAACKDMDWVRLLEWEALQGTGKVIDEKERLAVVARGLERIRQRQACGRVSAELDPRHVMLTMRSLTMFPVAFPQLTEMIMGKSVSDPKFQRERAEFLKKFAVAFQPVKVQAVKTALPNRNRMKKFISISTVGAMAFTLVVTMLVNGCSRGAKKEAAGAPVLVTKSVATNVPVQIDPPPVGHVTAYSTVTVHSQIGGIISEVHFQEGQEVKKGDLLFTIDPRPTQAALDQARAALERDQAQLNYAKINFAREQKLFDQKLISQDELDTNKASLGTLLGTVSVDKAAITNALLNLEFCHIRSPIDGKTGSLQAYAGNVVKAPDDILLTINQIHPTYVAFAVPEQYLTEIKKEMREKKLKVSVAFQNMEVTPPQGELTFIDNSVDETTGTIQLRATFPNEGGALWPGQFVEVELTLSELTNAVVVPSQVVQTGQNGQFIYVVKPDQTVEDRPVTIGITYQDETVVEKGLQTGETVVTDGQLLLAPGVKVSVKSLIQSAVTATNAP